MAGPRGAKGAAFRPWRHRFALLTVGATLILIFIGGLVTSTGSALAVPDWPLSYGMLMPPMVGGIRYEHGHRMAATLVGLLTLVLAIWTAREEPRRNVRLLAWGALATVIAQGILGGLTVLFLLPLPVSVAHACLAQTFFCILIALAYATSREALGGSVGRPDVARLRGAALLAAAAIWSQLLIGALMRHMHAGLAIPDFPLALGRIVPPFTSSGVVVHFVHRVFALVVVALVLRTWLRARRSGDSGLPKHAAGTLLLVAVQIALGAAAVLSGRSVLPTTAHVATGAALLGSSWLLALRAEAA